VTPLSNYTSVGFFSGAGGLDLGFESAGFVHRYSSDIDSECCNTMSMNRPGWIVECADVRNLEVDGLNADVVLAGFPCQGFSLGGHRRIEDSRNEYFRDAIRLVNQIRPTVVVFENVLNMRTMSFDGNVSAAETIKTALQEIGYETTYDSFRVSRYGVPQTRRRFVFVGVEGGIPDGYLLPRGTKNETSIRDFVYDLAADSIRGSLIELPNHSPKWEFKSKVHKSRFHSLAEISELTITPLRLSRTASDGNPVRSFDAPFPAIDTGTIWGWGAGKVHAERFLPDRSKRQYVRNKESTARLWKIESDILRRFTGRELARIQTFPDNWIFSGNGVSDIQKQIGNAVPVKFSSVIARSVKNLLDHKHLGIDLKGSKSSKPFSISSRSGLSSLATGHASTPCL